MNFESLIFDIDGTLWDSRALVAEGYNAQLKDEGMERFSVDAEVLKTVFGKVMTEIADIIFGELPEEQRYPLMDRCMEREKDTLRNDPCEGAGYPKVKETLEELHRKHRLFIVSNSQCGYPEVCMEKLGLTDFVSGHLCFGDTGTCKGETIKKLMKDHNITSACYIGDTAGDMEASEYAGIPFVFCTFGFGEAPRYWKKIDKFEQLLEL
jgi:phosphoglycolate phosphatase